MELMSILRGCPRPEVPACEIRSSELDPSMVDGGGKKPVSDLLTSLETFRCGDLLLSRPFPVKKTWDEETRKV